MHRECSPQDRIPAVLRRYHWTLPGNITLPIGVNGGTFLETVPAGDEVANDQMLPVKMGHTVFDTAFRVHVQLISPIRSSWHLIHLDNIQWLPKTVSSILSISSLGEEALTMYLAKNKLDRKLANATQNVEALHQLASSYFIDRDGTMRKLHEIQISSSAIKVGECR